MAIMEIIPVLAEVKTLPKIRMIFAKYFFDGIRGIALIMNNERKL